MYIQCTRRRQCRNVSEFFLPPSRLLGSLEFSQIERGGARNVRRVLFKCDPRHQYAGVTVLSPVCVCVCVFAQNRPREKIGRVQNTRNTVFDRYQTRAKRTHRFFFARQYKNATRCMCRKKAAEITQNRI